jgi:hypothetical protein
MWLQIEKEITFVIELKRLEVLTTTNKNIMTFWV